MSGLYGCLFGENSDADKLLAVLGLDRKSVPRFQDCYWNGDHIVIHTRTGGGNREDYQDENTALTVVPGYVYDEDDDFDSTYADFYFRPPCDMSMFACADLTPHDKWQLLIANLKQAEEASRKGGSE